MERAVKWTLAQGHAPQSKRHCRVEAQRKGVGKNVFMFLLAEKKMKPPTESAVRESADIIKC